MNDEQYKKMRSQLNQAEQLIRAKTTLVQGLKMLTFEDDDDVNSIGLRFTWHRVPDRKSEVYVALDGKQEMPILGDFKERFANKLGEAAVVILKDMIEKIEVEYENL